MKHEQVRQVEGLVKAVVGYETGYEQLSDERLAQKLVDMKGVATIEQHLIRQEAARRLVRRGADDGWHRVESDKGQG